MVPYTGYKDDGRREEADELASGCEVDEEDRTVHKRMPPRGFTKPQRTRSDLLEQPGIAGAIARFWTRSYAPDYVGLVLLECAYLYIHFFAKGFHRMFSLDDRSKSYPFALVERVPSLMNLIYAGLVPGVFILAWAAVLRLGVHQTHVAVLGLFISHALASFLTNVVKNAVGRPRPDLTARCLPAKGTPGHELVTVDVCTQTDQHILQDGWKSFPSGHSSFAFAGLGYLALFLAGQLHIFRPRADLTRVILAMAPLIGAALIAISRLEDYRHDVYDVTAGTILGFAIAYYSYRRYYPPLTSPRCHEPYSSRATFASLNNSAGKMRRDDEEQPSSPDVANFVLDDLAEDDPAEIDPLRYSSRDNRTTNSRDPG